MLVTFCCDKVATAAAAADTLSAPAPPSPRCDTRTALTSLPPFHQHSLTVLRNAIRKCN